MFVRPVLSSDVFIVPLQVREVCEFVGVVDFSWWPGVLAISNTGEEDAWGALTNPFYESFQLGPSSHKIVLKCT